MFEYKHFYGIGVLTVILSVVFAQFVILPKRAQAGGCSLNVNGKLYQDANGNKVYDTGETPLGGVNVKIEGRSVNGDATYTTVSDVNGNYNTCVASGFHLNGFLYISVPNPPYNQVYPPYGMPYRTLLSDPSYNGYEVMFLSTCDPSGSVYDPSHCGNHDFTFNNVPVTPVTTATTSSSSSSNSGTGDQGIHVQPDPNNCGATVPVGQPDLFQINVTDKTATIYFTPVRDNTGHYYVSYGHDEAAQSYGYQKNDLGDNLGVQSIVIGELQPNTTYYFKVRPGNGCATGTWSHWMKVTTNAAGQVSTRSMYYY